MTEPENTEFVTPAAAVATPASVKDEGPDVLAQILAEVVLPPLAKGRTVTGPPDWNPQASIAVASYNQRFDHLWRFPQALLDWLAGGNPPAHPRTLILVWDGVVPLKGKGAGLAAEYLSATDWAVALAMKAGPVNQSESPWRVLILDLSPNVDSPSLTKRLFQLSQQRGKLLLPMISVYRPTGIEEFLGAINERAPAPAAMDRDLVNRLWASAIVQPEDPQMRHSVANLVGPGILLAGMRAPQPVSAKPKWTERRNLPAPSAQPAPQKSDDAELDSVGALQQMLRAFDLVPVDAGKEVAPWIAQPEGGWANSFILIDDMAELGWAAFVEAALDLKPGQLKVCTSPDRNGLGKSGSKNLLQLLVDEKTGGLRVQSRTITCWSRKRDPFSRSQAFWPEVAHGRKGVHWKPPAFGAGRARYNQPLARISGQGVGCDKAVCRRRGA